MTNPLDESAKAAAEWVETTPDTVLQACGLVNAYQLGWMDGAMRCADKQAAKRVRPRIGTIPVADQGPAGRHRGHRGQGRIRHGLGGGVNHGFKGERNEAGGSPRTEEDAGRIPARQGRPHRHQRDGDYLFDRMTRVPEAGYCRRCGDACFSLMDGMCACCVREIEYEKNWSII